MKPYVIGRKLFWIDPDQGLCNDWVTILDLLNDDPNELTYCCQSVNGGVIEALHVELREDMFPTLPDDKCPFCQSKVETGFGLAYGGYGTYCYCTGDDCSFFSKDTDEEGMEDCHR